MVREVCGRSRGSWAWLGTVLVSVSCLLTACGGSGGSTGTASASASAGCAAGHTDITVAARGAVEQRVCVRPGTVISLVLEARTDDKRWTAVQSSAPGLVVVSGWQVEQDGTARASLRCAGTRGGTAKVTALAKAPDVAGAAKAAFTLDVGVVPYTTKR
ncbi:hypothetical protein [Streptomyces sp. V3I7]|uniref:hypothetical protein n=1 Tax=Streptomyces sp. V3I7 TaxID=3042278 RepID=UPI0027821D55|nr:hypothetical protein [Streptomyces sp. V3I7]MDQ0993836.1 hypothetical protein [Streptomyces sp. V3I7]